jgi:hypothetical protein
MNDDKPNPACKTEADALPSDALLSLKADIRQCWRMLGMVHLRMHNDLQLKSRKTTSRAEIYGRLDEVSRRLDAILADYFPEE